MGSECGPLDVGVDLTGAVFSCAALAVCTKLECSMLSPEGSPRILDEPVLGAPGDIALTVANDSDGVVHVFDVRATAVAVTVVYDTIRVATKAGEVRVDGDSDGALCHELLQTLIGDHVLFVARSVTEPLESAARVYAFLLATTITPRVSIPVNDAFVSSEVVGIGHPPAIAAPVLFVAV